MNGQWKQKDKETRGATMAQWICLRLPSCRPGSNPMKTMYAFIKLNLNCDGLKNTKVNRKRGRDWPILKDPPQACTRWFIIHW